MRVKIVCDGTYGGLGNGVFLEDGSKIDGVVEIHYHLSNNNEGLAVVDLVLKYPSANIEGVIRHLNIKGWHWFKTSLNIFLWRLGNKLRAWLK